VASVAALLLEAASGLLLPTALPAPELAPLPSPPQADKASASAHAPSTPSTRKLRVDAKGDGLGEREKKKGLLLSADRIVVAPRNAV